MGWAAPPGHRVPRPPEPTSVPMRVIFAGTPEFARVALERLLSAGFTVPLVLTQQRFESLAVGRWTRTDLQNTFGMPLRVEQVARFDGDIWTYRFRQNSDLRQAHVHLGRQGVVLQVLFTDELPKFDNARD